MDHSPAPPASGSLPKHVLIVEDDDDARDVLGELVMALGHHPLQAATAKEALAFTLGSRVDIALIDLGLGGSDGCDVARRIREAEGGGAIRLVALTGYSDERTRRNAADAGFDHFIVKPAHTEALEAVLGA